MRDVTVRRGSYQDSVTLMQVSRELSGREDVVTVQVAMATELNLDLLAQLGFEVPADASPNDMVVAIETDTEEAVATATAALDEILARRPGASSGLGDGVPPAPTVGTAARRVDATLALVSTPGRVAAIDAADALAAGLDVMVFSDNVSVDHEVALKTWAGDAGLLVMGPDCGTAVVDGVGLGFANVVRPGPVGIVAASGTGAQHLLSLLDGAGVGVRHCLGVGGRDLSAEVGGRSTITALDRLAADAGVETIVVVSKPPAADVAEQVSGHAATLRTPVVMGYLGPGRPDITATAQRVVEAAGERWTAPRRWGGSPTRAEQGFLRGLYSGGTLCDEAMLIAAEAFGTVARNIPLTDQPTLGADLASQGHTFIDFGDDQLTAGRPHPMIEPGAAQRTTGPRARRRHLRGRSPRRRARSRRRTPTRPPSWPPSSPPPRSRWSSRSSAPATTPKVSTHRPSDWPRPVRSCMPPTPPRPARPSPWFRTDRVAMSTETVVTAGAELLAEALRVQGVTTEAVDWTPPVAGTEHALTTVMLDRRRAEANAEAVRRMTGRPGCPGRRPARVRGTPAPTRGSSCTPARRSAGSGPPGRCGARLIGAVLFEGLASTRRRRPRRSSRAARSRGSPATIAARSGRWPAWSPRRCGCSSCTTRCTTTRRGAR